MRAPTFFPISESGLLVAQDVNMHAIYNVLTQNTTCAPFLFGSSTLRTSSNHDVAALEAQFSKWTERERKRKTKQKATARTARVVPYRQYCLGP